MRRFLQPHTLVPVVIIAAVAAMVASANIRDVRRSRQPYTAAPPVGTPGAPTTSREDLERRVADMERAAAGTSRRQRRGVAARGRAAAPDARHRQRRPDRRAEQVLTRVLHDDPGSYDANRMLATLYLSQHRFQEAIRVAERSRDERPVRPGELRRHRRRPPRARRTTTRRSTAFDRMMALRPERAVVRAGRVRARAAGEPGRRDRGDEARRRRDEPDRSRRRWRGRTRRSAISTCSLARFARRRRSTPPRRRRFPGIHSR